MPPAVPANYDAPLPGPVAEPAPPRRAGSVRRTSHLDVTRSDQQFGITAVAGAARDLRTTQSGATVLGSATLAVTIAADGTIGGSVHTPADVDLAELVGARPGFGFRSDVKLLLGRLAGTPLGLLVDDLSGAPAPSGYGAIRERVLLGLAEPPMPARPVTTGATRADVCAGWRAGGLPERSRSAGVPMPFEAEPPVAPSLVGDDDLAWHVTGALGARQSRRIRRLDLWREDGRLMIDAMFRDSTADPDLTARVVHEYALTAVVDATTMILLEVQATPRSLPFPTDCPFAAAGASNLVGEDVAGLRSTVRHVSRGPGSCTHLNDLYRSLADVPALAATLG